MYGWERALAHDITMVGPFDWILPTTIVELFACHGGTVCVYINTVGPFACILTRWDRLRVYYHGGTGCVYITTVGPFACILTRRK